MQFYLKLFLDTDGNMTLSKLGAWEEENMFEYESYIGAYVHRLELEAAARRKQRQRTK